MHFCKLVILLAAALSFGIFLGQQGQPTTFSTPSASAKSTTTTSSSDNLNNFYLEDAKQDLDWATADAIDKKIGLTSFQLGQVHQDTTSSACYLCIITKFYRDMSYQGDHLRSSGGGNARPRLWHPARQKMDLQWTTGCLSISFELVHAVSRPLRTYRDRK